MEERERQVREAARKLRELEQKGATLDDILNGPEGYVWIEEACGRDRERRLKVSLKSCEIEETPATPGARLVDTAPRIEPSALYSPRFSD